MIALVGYVIASLVVIIAFVVVLVDVMLIDGDAPVSAATDQLAHCWATGHRL